MENAKNQNDSKFLQTIRSIKERPKRHSLKTKTNLLEEVNKNSFSRMIFSKEQKERKNKPNGTIKSKKLHSSDKIYIDGSSDKSLKQTKSFSNQVNNNNLNKIRIISKTKQIIQQNPLLLKTTNYGKNSPRVDLDKYKYFKSKTKYMQNLLSDASVKKYKQSCLDMIKNDLEIKNLYDKCGFEKTNNFYDTFLYRNFFENQLFMLKLEIIIMDDKNFGKKNFKEIFFKKEIKKYLENHLQNFICKNQISNLNKSINETSDLINNFNLFHE